MKMKTNRKIMNSGNKKICCLIFDFYIENGYINTGKALIYGILKEHNIIDPPKEEIIKSCDNAIDYFKNNTGLFGINQHNVKYYNRRDTYMVKNKAKVLILENFFEEIHKENKHLKDYLI